MTDHPLVSVIVPVYNGAKYLAHALVSIFQQDCHPIEVIVVDDGSVDRTAEIASCYEKVTYVYQSNRGEGAARNTGIQASAGKFIAFLDADDVWAPRKLSVQMVYRLL